MAANIDIIVNLVDKASGPLGKIQGAAGKMGGILKAGALVGGVALVGLIGIGVKLVQQAAEEEASIKRLAAAVDASGGSWAKSGKQIEAVIKTREKLAFSDDVLRSSLAILTAITGDSDEALRRQSVAMDFARGANIDLELASKLLGKVTDENVNVLGRYGIRVKEGADATDVLALVQQKFAGQSQAFAESTAGKWANFNIALDNVKETIGAALLPLASELADKLSTFLRDHEEQIGRAVEAWVAFAQNEAFPAIKQFFLDAKPVIKDMFDAFTAGLDLVKPFFDYIFDNKEALIVAIGAIGLAVATALGPGTAAAFAIAGIITALGLVSQVAVETFDKMETKRTEDLSLWERWALELKMLLEKTGEGIGNILTGDWGGAWSLFLAFLETRWQGTLIWLGVSFQGWMIFIEAQAKLWIKGLTDSIATLGWVFDFIFEPFGITIKGIGDAVGWLISQIERLIAALGRVKFPGLTLGFSLKGLSPFQHGGIVTRPTVALLGEAGPEAVIPLRGAGGAIGAGATIIINISGTWDLSNPNHIERLTSALMTQLRRNLAMGA